MTGADLENLANEAPCCLEEQERTRYMRDFEEAKDILLMGAVREETINDMEKKITAYHEQDTSLLPGNCRHRPRL